MKFLVQYQVHIDEERRPKDEGFMPMYPINHIYEVNNDDELGELINKNYQVFIQSVGITVFKDATSVREPGTGNVANRMFIPWKLISYLDVPIIKLLTEQKAPPSQALLEPSKEDVPVKEKVTVQ